jgi:hypothetical protein
MSHTEAWIEKSIKTKESYIARREKAGKVVPRSHYLRVQELYDELAVVHEVLKVVPVTPVRPPVLAVIPPAAPVATNDWYNPSAGEAGSPQAVALGAADTPYILAGYGQSGVWLPGFTPNTARAWWAAFFAAPFDMRLVDPAALPGSLVLSAEDGKRAVALGKVTNPPPPATCAGIPCPPNPNLFEGSSTLAAIRQMQAEGNPYYPPFYEGVTFPTTRPAGGT